MKMRPLSALSLAALAVVTTTSGAALAQDGLVANDNRAASDDAGAAQVDDDTPPPEQAALDPLVGNWRCKGKAATERSPDADVTITLSVKKELGGRWLVVKSEESKSKDNPKPTLAHQVWGYSREQSTFVQNGADNHGGFYAGSSTGWVGERLWWVADAARGGKRAKLKQTFTKQGKDLGLEIALDPSGTGDAYRVTFEGVCKK